MSVDWRRLSDRIAECTAQQMGPPWPGQCVSCGRVECPVVFRRGPYCLCGDCIATVLMDEEFEPIEAFEPKP